MVLLRVVFGGLSAVTWRVRPEEVAMRREERGKPYVAGAPEFNLSHTAGRMIAAFSSEPVGIDVESACRDGAGRRRWRESFSSTRRSTAL